MNRYTYRQLNAQAKQAFRSVQRERPDGGMKRDYKYKDLLINGGYVSQILNYDVNPTEAVLKQSRVIHVLSASEQVTPGKKAAAAKGD